MCQTHTTEAYTGTQTTLCATAVATGRIFVLRAGNAASEYESETAELTPSYQEAYPQRRPQHHRVDLCFLSILVYQADPAHHPVHPDLFNKHNVDRILLLPKHASTNVAHRLHWY